MSNRRLNLDDSEFNADEISNLINALENVALPVAAASRGMRRSPAVLNVSELADITVNDIISSVELNNRSDIKQITKAKIRLMGNDNFFDEYITLLKQHYTSYLQLNERKAFPLYAFNDIINEELPKYLAKKTGSRTSRFYDLQNSVKEYMYNEGIIPSLITRNRPRNNTVRVINNMPYRYTYFLWIRENDPKVQPANPNEVITTSNFDNYAQRFIFDSGWSENQLRTFITTTIMPPILQAAGLSINIEHPVYKQCIRRILSDKNDMGRAIKHYINTNSIEIGQSMTWDMVHNFNLNATRGHPFYILFNLIKCLRKTQIPVRLNIRDKFKRAAKNAMDTHYQRRFKWMNLCNILNEIPKEDLIELAQIEGVSDVSMLNKRQLCAELSKKYNERINKVHSTKSQCSNQDSVLTLEPINDIAPEFFYAYTHNNVMYCDDIRQLVKYFDRFGAIHPADRTRLPERLIATIRSEYDKLKRITNHMQDFNAQEEEPIMSLQSTLTAKSSTFTSLLNYPNPTQLFMDSNSELFNRFINKLKDEFILSRNEISQINSGESLMDKKIRFLDIITLKIINDPEQINTPSGQLSSIAINTTHVYNDTFVPENE